MSDRPTVLIVDDVQDTVDMYADMLGDGYDVRMAYDGWEALDALDADVDVVLLDRRMPGLSGYDVVEEIRERDCDARIAMVTASEPNFDIADRAFNDYVTKPVSITKLRETVDGLVSRRSYDERSQEYFTTASKLAVLEVNKTQQELQQSETYDELQRQYERLTDELDDTIEELEAEHPGAAFEELV